MYRIGAYNCPWRYGVDRIAADMQRAVDQYGVVAIATQENRDIAPALICPDGWEWHRPKRAQSAAVFWDPKVFRATKRGARRLSSPRRATRFLVWVHLRSRLGGPPLRLASIHAPAFASRARWRWVESVRQIRKIAAWQKGGRWRVVAGDWNASWRSLRMRAVRKVANPSKPFARSGPKRQRIDYCTRRKDQRRPRTVASFRGASDHAFVIMEV